MVSNSKRPSTHAADDVVGPGARPRGAHRRGPEPEQCSAPGYPSLLTHLATRRSFLSWTGASLFTAATSVCCISGKIAAGVRYYRLRIPEAGDMAVTLTGGGSIRFYVNVACYSDNGYQCLGEEKGQELCRQVLGSHSYAELSAVVAQGVAGPLHVALENEIHDALLESDSLADDQWDLEVTLTILSLTA